MALAHRNLSRSELSWEPTNQLSHARMAYECAVKARRSDLVWFAHGAFNSCLSNNLLGEEAAHWLATQERELGRIRNGEVRVDSKNNVVEIWETGYLMDRAALEGSREPLERALEIAKAHNLVLRVKQIEALLVAFDQPAQAQS